MFLRTCDSRAVAIVLVYLLGAGSAGAADRPPDSLIIGSQRLADDDIPVEAVRGSGIAGALNPAALGTPRLRLALPDGRVLVAIRQRIVEDAPGGQQSWIGTFVEMPGSLAVLSKARSVTTGFITYGAETFEIMPTKGGRHMIYEIDSSWLPDGEPVLLPDDLAGNAEATVTYDTNSTDTGDRFVHDLLVVYTPASRMRYGQAALESKVLAAVAAANQAYLNSIVRITLNLVGLQEVDYTEASSIVDSLSHLRNPSDGILDDVHVLRDLLGADVVSLVSEDVGCGLAYLMSPESSAFASYAFSVVYSGCLSQHSLAHELGHNQGNMHDRANGAGAGVFEYSYGLRRCMTDGTGFRTVMSSNCVGASRVTQFSNPDVTYNGWPTGISYESDPAGSADNARSMNETADTVAVFRSISSSAPAAPSSLRASALSADAALLTWSDNAIDESGFRVERSGNGVEFAEVATLAAGTTAFTDAGLTARMTYWYRVQAFNGAGHSDHSATVPVTMPDVSPEPPADVAALDNGDGSATVSWIDASSNATGFEARREAWDARRGVWKNAMTAATVPAGITSLVDTPGNGTFRYSIRALGIASASGFAGPAQVNVTGARKGNGKGRTK